jgi:ketosteroid isomerase-like protein
MLGEEPVSDGADGVVRRLFDAFAARDVVALLEIVDPEIEFFGPTAMAVNEGRCYRGHDGMRRYLRDADALWEELDLDPQKLRVVGSHVVALGRVRARARDGLEIDTAAAWVWRVEHGRVTWGCAYGDPDQMPRSLQESARGPSTFESLPSPMTDESIRTPEPLR